MVFWLSLACAIHCYIQGMNDSGSVSASICVLSCILKYKESRSESDRRNKTE